MVEIMEISSIDNKRKSVLAVPVALSSDSYLQWVGFNVTNGMSFSQPNDAMHSYINIALFKLIRCKQDNHYNEISIFTSNLYTKQVPK